MKNAHRRSARHLPRKIVTTLGDLISAAYDAADGFGKQRLDKAASILTQSPLARCMSKQLQFVR